VYYTSLFCEFDKGRVHILCLRVRIWRFLVAFVYRMPFLNSLLLLLLALLPMQTIAVSAPPAPFAEQIRADLTAAQLSLLNQPATAQRQFAHARALVEQHFIPTFAPNAPDSAERLQQSLIEAERALDSGDALAFAMARSSIWTALLAGAYTETEHALQDNQPELARQWLGLREYRRAAPSPGVQPGAALALERLASGQWTMSQAIDLVRRDLLESYQSRLDDALRDLARNPTDTLHRAEVAAQAQGYFAIVAPMYGQQRGAAALAEAEQAFAELVMAARQQAPLTTPLERVQALLQGFRAAPLSEAEQTERAGQLLRFLALVPIEYERGFEPTYSYDVELIEAQMFLQAARDAFRELQPSLAARDVQVAQASAERLARLAELLEAARAYRAEPNPIIRQESEAVLAQLRSIMPSDWQRASNASDMALIRTALDDMAQAAQRGDCAQAEAARINAYAMLESGPEARLLAFAPHLKVSLESHFWYGSGQQPGLAALLAECAPAEQVLAARASLERELSAAERTLRNSTAPMAVASQAAVIVFREGLEAVLILASLLASMQIGAQRRFRRPLWVGAALAFAATLATWLLFHQLLTWLSRYGQYLEAVVSLIAVGVLLLITNWYFHHIYWTGWLAGFQQRKRLLLAGVAGQTVGLVLLGFTSVYREGFETALFLQALVLDAGPRVVLIGGVLGFAVVLLVGFAVFGLQARLPYKRMLIVTGVLIGAVLLTMVGQTVYVMQLVGWLPIHPIGTLVLPLWMGLWFGLYATWEGVIAQLAAAAFVIGSYVLAERSKRGR
jgi:high-affinity iron transporter